MLASFARGFLVSFAATAPFGAAAILYAHRSKKPRTVRRIAIAVIVVWALCGWLATTGDDYQTRCEANDDYDVIDCNPYGDVGMQFVLIVGTCATLAFIAWSNRSRLIYHYGSAKPPTPGATPGET